MDQLKILFVDDEVLVRVGLSSIINWNKYGCVVIGDAPSAEKALEIIDKERPHVIFTDIRMPQMSGIELIKKVRERYGENIYIVILTSHDEFEYAHQAIRYGVTDYVLKFSLTSESILAILEKIRGCIKKIGSLPKTQEIHVAEQRSTNRFFINILLENINAPASEIDELMQRLSIPFAYADGRYVVCAVSVLELSKKVLAGKIIDEIKFLDNFNQILMNKLMIFGIKEIFPVNNNTYVFMTEIQQEKNQIQEIISTINFAAETYLNCSLFMGVSLPCDGVGMLATGTVQALAAREQQFYTHETNLCVFEEKQQPDIMEIFSPKAEDELYHSLLLLQTDHAIAVIEHCLNVCKKHQVSMSGIDTLLERINLIFSKTASKCFVELEQLTPEQSLPAAVCAEQFESVFELEQRLIDDVNRLVKIISVAKKQNYHDEIRKIKSYIEKNYMNDISLEMVAKHVGMSRNYTSSIFKKSTGENLVDYLNRFRIEKAYCFIIEENKNVSQAAEMVGFNNINYFSNMFKKIKGINPSTLKRKSQ